MSEPAEGFEHTATGLERMIKACGATFECNSRKMLSLLNFLRERAPEISN